MVMRGLFQLLYLKGPPPPPTPSGCKLQKAQSLPCPPLSFQCPTQNGHFMNIYEVREWLMSE